MASSEDRAKWNSRYRDGTHMLPDPDPFLIKAFRDFVSLEFPHGGSALDLAGGAGRHSIYLAQMGWRVTLLDIAEAGLERARQNAGALASHIHFAVDDLTQFRAAQTQFDLVIVFYYLERAIFPEIVKAIKAGGFLVYRTYTVEQKQLQGGPSDPKRMLAAGELRRLASELQVLHYHEEVAEKATAMLVARRR